MQKPKTSLIQPLAYQIRSKRPYYRQAEDRLLWEIGRRVKPDETYVSFSAGKDSAVLAHAAHSVFPGIQMCLVDPGVPYHWLDDERTMWLDYAREHGWNLRVFPWDKWGGVLADDQEQRVSQTALHEDMFAEVTAWAREHGYTTALIGLRQQESRQRTMALRKYGMDHTYEDGRRRVCPLSHWGTDDVWTYIVSHGLPWLSIYDHLGPTARNGLIGRNAIKQGRMVYLKHFYPEAFRVARDVLSLEYAR